MRRTVAKFGKLLGWFVGGLFVVLAAVVLYMTEGRLWFGPPRIEVGSSFVDSMHRLGKPNHLRAEHRDGACYVRAEYSSGNALFGYWSYHIEGDSRGRVTKYFADRFFF